MASGLYESAWRAYSRRTRANEIGLCAIAILIALISTKPALPLAAALLPVVCLAVSAKTVRSEWMLRCPRCRSSWNGSLFAVAPSRSECQHCGLAKWEGFSRHGLLRHRRLIGSMRLISGAILGAAGIFNVLSSQPLGWPDVVLAAGYFTLAFLGPDGWWQAKEALARAHG